MATLGPLVNFLRLGAEDEYYRNKGLFRCRIKRVLFNLPQVWGRENRGCVIIYWVISLAR